MDTFFVLGGFGTDDYHWREGMDKQEFITLLAETLSGEVPADVIQENLNYYRQYLSDEIAKGRNEQDVLNELGDPRLIAKTIIDACPESAENQGMNEYEDRTYRQSDSEADYGSRSSYEGQSKWKYIDLNKWYWKLAGILLLFAVFWIVFKVVGGIVFIAFRLAWPLLIIWMVYVLIRSSKHK